MDDSIRPHKLVQQGDSMSALEQLIEGICNQMMKGPHNGRLKATEEQRIEFRKRYEDSVRWIVARIPKYSTAVGAVLTKCLLKYGPEKIEPFCKALNNKKFKGTNDPAHVLWLFLSKSKGKQPLEVYKKSLAAVKSFLKNEDMVALRGVNSDIFEWEENYTVPKF